MPQTDIQLSSVARTFHALSDPTRLQIIELLMDGERCVCELTDSLEAAQSRLSFHLRVLKDAGMVSDRRDGRWVYYTLSNSAIEDASGFLGSITESHQPAPVRRARKVPVVPCCD